MKPELVLAAVTVSGVDDNGVATSVTVTRDDTFAVTRADDTATIHCADGDIVLTSRIACSKLAAAAVSALALLVSP